MTEITDIHGGIHRIDFDNLESAYINCDCMEALRKMPDKCVDLAICDPPYGIKESGTKSATRLSLANAKRFGGGKYVKSYKEYAGGDKEPPSAEYFNELIRVSRNQIIWGANHFISKIPYDSSCWIVWDKKNGDNDFADCELAYTSFKSAVRKFSYLWNGLQQESIKNKEYRIHPNQKPVALYEWLLSRYAKEGDVILDTHVGSASSLIACYRTNHKFIGFELDEYYYKKSKERLDAEMAQMRLCDFMEV